MYIGLRELMWLLTVLLISSFLLAFSPKPAVGPINWGKRIFYVAILITVYTFFYFRER